MLVQEDGTSPGTHHRLAVLDGLRAKDVDVSVRFQARVGGGARGAGLSWRGQDDHNVYLLHSSALGQEEVRFVGTGSLGVDLPPVGR